MSVHMRAKDGRWFVAWREEGRQKRRVFGKGAKGKTDAEAYQDVLDSRGGVSLEKLVEEFVLNRTAQMRGKKYCDQMEALVEVSGLKYMPVRKLSEDQFFKAVAGIRKKVKGEDGKIVQGPAISPITVNRYLSYFKVLLNYGVKKGHLEKNPLATWTKVKEPPRVLRLNEEDLVKIYEKAAPHLKWVITCMTNLGCRPGPSELFSIEWVDFDWEQLQVSVPCGKTRGERRIVPITERFAKLCEERKKEAKTGYLCEYSGKPIRKIRRSFTHALKAAGITYRASLYDLRHLYATTLLRRGADIKAVSEMLGHKNTQMTVNVYHHALPQEKRRAVQYVPSVGSNVGSQEEQQEGQQ